MSRIERIEGLIRRYDETIRYRQQLFGFNLAEEVTSVLQTCVKNQETLTAQLDEKTKECEYFRECLKIAHDKVAKLYAEFENRTNYYQGLLKNNYAKECLEFAIFLKTRNESNEKAKVALNSANDDSFRCYEDYLIESLIDDNIKNELEELKLKFEDKTGECDQLKILLIEANEQISTLNSKIKAARESVENFQRGGGENEGKSLDDTLLKYQQPVQPVEKTKETQNRTLSDHFTTNECNQTENYSVVDFNHGFPISPPHNFRDDDTSVTNINSLELFTGEQEHHVETNTLEETSDFSVGRKFWERVPRHLNYFVDQSTISLPAAETESSIQSNVCDIEIDHHVCPEQEFFDSNPLVNDFKSIAAKNGNAVDLVENDVIDTATYELSQPLEMNENLASSMTLSDLPISPPSYFRDDDVLLGNIDQHEFFPEKREHYEKTNTFEEISNLSVVRVLRKRVPRQSSNYFASESSSTLNAAANASMLQSGVSHGQESNDVNSLVDNSESLAVGNCNTVDVNAFGNSFVDPDMQKIPEPFETNENAVASKNSISQFDELKNSVTPVQLQFTCDICKKSFPKKVGLTCHMRIHKISRQSFHCEKCGKSFVSKRRGQKLAKCPNCDVGYNTRSREKELKLMSSSLETKKNGEFSDDDYTLTKCEKGNSSVRCDICGKNYVCNSTLKKHIREVHERKKPFECNICGQRFAQKVHLKSHTATHGSDKPFKCSVCNKCFRHLRTKRHHKRVVHEGYVPFQCAHCDKRCTHKYNLISHIFAQHFPGTRKQFKCDICDKSFAIRQNLNRHKLVHTSQRSFKCSICNLRFKRHEHKLRHERNVHGENDRVHCAHCEKSYSSKHYLSQHLRKIHL